MKKKKKADKNLNKRSVRKIESKQTWEEVQTARPYKIHEQVYLQKSTNVALFLKKHVQEMVTTINCCRF